MGEQDRQDNTLTQHKALSQLADVRFCRVAWLISPLPHDQNIYSQVKDLLAGVSVKLKIVPNSEFFVSVIDQYILDMLVIV